MVPRRRRRLRHRVHGDRSTTATRAAASAPPTARSRSASVLDPDVASRALRAARPRVPAARRATAACSNGAVTPKPPSTSPGSPVCAPVAVICEVLHDDGSPARFPYLELFAEEHRIAMISVAQLVEYREQAGTSRRGAAAARCSSDRSGRALLGGADGLAVDDLVEVLREAVAGAARCTTTRSCPRRCASRAARPRVSCGGCAAG